MLAFDSEKEDLLHIDVSELLIGEIIGKGWFSKVKKATWRGQKVVKQFRPSAGISEQEFLREATILSHVCNHSCVVKLLGITWIKPKKPAIITCYMPKGSVEILILKKREPLCVLQLIRMALDAARGLEHLHKNDVIHRDLAARNLLADDDFHVRLGDFGMSRFASKGYTDSDTRPLKWTAPECFRKKTFSEASDVFSFGVVLYELFVQKEPWAELSNVEAAFEVAEGGRMDLNCMPDNLSALRELTHQCWEQHPTNRLKVSEIISILEKQAEFHSPKLHTLPEMQNPSLSADDKDNDAEYNNEAPKKMYKRSAISCNPMLMSHHSSDEDDTDDRMDGERSFRRSCEPSFRGPSEKSQNKQTPMHFAHEYHAFDSTLLDYMWQGPYPEDIVRFYCSSLIDIIAEYRSQGINHLVLQPEDLQLDQDYQLRVCDDALSPERTIPEYMAPEALEAQSFLESKFDSWTIALMLFVLATGNLPMKKSKSGDWFFDLIRSNNRQMFWVSHQHGEIVLSGPFQSLVDSILVIDPDLRPTLTDVRQHTWFQKSQLLVEEIKAEMAQRHIINLTALKAEQLQEPRKFAHLSTTRSLRAWTAMKARIQAKLRKNRGLEQSIFLKDKSHDDPDEKYPESKHINCGNHEFIRDVLLRKRAYCPACTLIIQKGSIYYRCRNCNCNSCLCESCGSGFHRQKK